MADTLQTDEIRCIKLLQIRAIRKKARARGAEAAQATSVDVTKRCALREKVGSHGFDVVKPSCVDGRQRLASKAETISDTHNTVKPSEVQPLQSVPATASEFPRMTLMCGESEKNSSEIAGHAAERTAE